MHHQEESLRLLLVNCGITSLIWNILASLITSAIIIALPIYSLLHLVIFIIFFFIFNFLRMVHYVPYQMHPSGKWYSLLIQEENDMILSNEKEKKKENVFSIFEESNKTQLDSYLEQLFHTKEEPSNNIITGILTNGYHIRLQLETSLSISGHLLIPTKNKSGYKSLHKEEPSVRIYITKEPMVTTPACHDLFQRNTLSNGSASLESNIVSSDNVPAANESAIE